MTRAKEVGRPEVAQLLGVTVARIDQLVKQSDFPQPARVETRGKRSRRWWDRKVIIRYGKATGRIQK